MVKKCNKCRKEKKLEIDFYRATGTKSAKSGYYPVCKACKNRKTGEYRKLHRARANEVGRESYKKNIIARRQDQRDWRRNNPEVDRARRRKHLYGLTPER